MEVLGIRVCGTRVKLRCANLGLRFVELALNCRGSSLEGCTFFLGDEGVKGWGTWAHLWWYRGRG